MEKTLEPTVVKAASDRYAEALQYFVRRGALAENGDESALEVFCEIHSVIDQLEAVKKAVYEAAKEECTKYKTEDLDLYSFAPEVYSSRKYSYKHSREWSAAADRKRAIEKRMREAANMAREGKEVTDTGTGEVIVPAKMTESTYIRNNRVRS